MERYLLHSAVASGVAIQAARDDYRNVSKYRQMQAALPKAWSQLIADEDGTLLEIVADRVESLCGFKPDPDMVANFLKSSVMGRGAVPAPSQYRPLPPLAPRVAANTPVAITEPITSPAYTAPMQPVKTQAAVLSSEKTGFLFSGQFHPCRNAIDTLKQVFELFIKQDLTFGERFAGLPKHGRTRRYLALDRNDLYQDRPDLVSECSIRLDSGWWMSINHSKQTIGQIIAMACDFAQVAYGRSLVAHLG